MLACDQPIERTAPRGALPAEPQGAFDLLRLSRLLWQRRIMIGSAALICACLAVATGKSLTARFTATAELHVDPRELQLVDRELTPRAQNLAAVVERQARLMTSNSVLLQVIRHAHLDSDPEFGGATKGLFTTLLGLFGIEWRAGSEVGLAQTTALEALNDHIAIRETDRSFVLDLDVWSKDPAKAAMLANAIAGAYLAESRNAQAGAARRAASDLSGRLNELKERLRNAENALTTYKAQSDFNGPRDTLVGDRQLSASNQRLAAARAQTIDVQARLDQIEASRRAELTAELGPLHPALRQTEKQVDDLRRTINEPAARVIGEATVPQRRSFPPAMNLVAVLGFILGALASAGWAVAVDRLPKNAPRPRDPTGSVPQSRLPAPAPSREDKSRKPAPVTTVEKPSIARLQDADVMRTLGAILGAGGSADITQLGWPTLRAGASAFLDAARAIGAAAIRHASADAIPVIALVGAGTSDERSIAALNFALALARDDRRVLLVDAGHGRYELSRRLSRLGKNKARRLGWLSIAGKTARPILTVDGLAILPWINGRNGKATDVIRRTLAARAYDLVILDGPAMPGGAAEAGLLEQASALVAVLPLHPDLDDSMDEIITALGSSQDRLVGVILNELGAVTMPGARGREYA